MRGTDSPDNSTKNSLSGEAGAAERILLLLLLLVVLLFGYVYFFTGIIKPRQEAANTPPVEAPVVKKPIPPRTEIAEKGTPSSVEPPTLSEKGNVPTAAQPNAPQQKQQVQEPRKQAVITAPAPPKPAAAAPKQSPKAHEATPVVKGGAKPSVASKPQSKEIAAAAKGSEKPTAGSKVLRKEVAARKTSERYSLLIGDFVLQKDLKTAQNKLKKAGISASVITTAKKKEPMHRIYVADFATRKEAEDELNKLKKYTGSAFILPENGKHSVFAGSFFTESQAAKERDRIAAKAGNDLKINLQKVDVEIPVKQLKAGGFATKENALKEALRLEKAGLRASVIETRK